MTNENAIETCPFCLASFSAYPLGEKDGFRLSGCRACGSVVVLPRPDGAMIEAFYKDRQMQVVAAPDPAREVAKAQWILRKVLPPPVKGRKRFLDVNAQRGYAARAAEQLGYEVRALNSLDIFHDYAVSAHSPRLFAHRTAMEEAETGAQYDVIIATLSFAEQTDVDVYTSALSRLLAPDGMLYIEEADGNHLNTPTRLADWSQMTPPVTTGLLSKKGMKALLARHGLVIRKNRWNWFPYMRLDVIKAKKKIGKID